jgi:hypothetical protein
MDGSSLVAADINDTRAVPASKKVLLVSRMRDPRRRLHIGVSRKLLQRIQELQLFEYIMRQTRIWLCVFRLWNCRVYSKSIPKPAQSGSEDCHPVVNPLTDLVPNTYCCSKLPNVVGRGLNRKTQKNHDCASLIISSNSCKLVKSNLGASTVL